MEPLDILRRDIDRDIRGINKIETLSVDLDFLGLPFDQDAFYFV
jgi:hypothetical protein